MKKNYFIITFLLVAFYSYAQEIDVAVLETPQASYVGKTKEIKDFAIYPNPVSNGILRITTFENAKKTVQIYDVLGKQVLSRTTTSQHLNISMLNSGIYILKVFEKGKIATRKLVVK